MTIVIEVKRTIVTTRWLNYRRLSRSCLFRKNNTMILGYISNIVI